MEITLKKFMDYYINPLKKNRGVSLELANVARKSTRLNAIIGLKQLTDLLVPHYDQIAEEAVRNKVEWTNEELCNQQKLLERGTGTPFWEAMLRRIRCSIAGQFIEDFNKGLALTSEINEIKLYIAKADLANTEEYPCIERENDIVDNIIDVLTKVIRSQDNNAITLKLFLRGLSHLRLAVSQIGILDIKLRRLNTLQVLILSGNLIEELPLDNLPSSLRFLEVHDNLVSNINSPKGRKLPSLLYLGLSSNCISDCSIMEGLFFMKHLCTLDLSNNDISNISTILGLLCNIPHLACLSLQGNPCSMVMSYKDITTLALPKLQNLDGTTIIDKEEQSERDIDKMNISIKEKEKTSSELCYSAELRIYVYRIMAIPKPVRTKKSKGYFQFEVQLPLLDDRLLVWEKCHNIFEIFKRCDIIPDPNLYTPELKTTGSSLTKETKAESILNDSKSGLKQEKYQKKNEQWEAEYEEFLSEDKEIEGGKKYLSEKISWSSIMKPTNAIVTVPVEPDKLIKLRDTLRSIITIRLYYKEEASKSGIQNMLVAKILVPAQIPQWKEEYCGYEWIGKKPYIAENCANVSNMRFAAGIKGTQKIKSGSYPVPTIPTCHVGISLTRLAR